MACFLAGVGVGIGIGVSDRLFQQVGKAGAVEDIVPQHKTARIIPDKLPADNECLRESVRRRLLRILHPHPEIAPIPQQTPERRQILRRTYEKDIPYPRQHQCADGIINHWLVIYGQQLLAHPLGDRIQACAGSPGQDNSFHNNLFTISSRPSRGLPVSILSVAELLTLPTIISAKLGIILGFLAFI